VTGGLNPRFTLDTFVVGSANRLAVTAGRTVAESPGSAYNPLFIYSASGLGKTHLLMAMGHAARRVAPGLNVEYLTLDEFVEEFHAAVAAGQGDAVRQRMQAVDMLLVDDVQFLTNRKEMQAELLRLTESLLSTGHQIVLASDRPPNEIADLDERLISRFSGGLVVDMGPPDYETRVAILRRKAEERGVSFGPGVLEAAAALDLANVRELMGALNRLVAYQAVSDAVITAETAREMLGGKAGGAPPAGTDVEGEPSAPAAPVAETAIAAPSGDEFATFLTDVAATVGRAVEAWRSRVAEAVLRWEGAGYRTARLEALLDQDTPGGIDEAIAAYVHDVDRLRALETEVAQLDPAAAGDAVFHDPGRLDEAEALATRVRAGVAPPPGPSGAYPLESLVVGPSNEIAVAAAREVIAAPGRRYNPLVIVGRPGLGKTHLLHAVGLELARRPGAIVACLSGSAFVDELIGAIDADRMDWWRARYRRATALLIDDIHLLAGKERSQEELFLLFNMFLDGERQLAFTMPAPPGEIPGLEPRIASRLAGGLVAELSEPDRTVRATLLERALADQPGTSERELIDYLADRPAASMLSVLDALQRVTAAAAAQDRPLTAALAREVLEGQLARDRRTKGMRTSGIVVSSASGVRSREKMVWEWPDVADRLVGDLP
jgi:chromosomal replication initiation ATPase DnaA